MNTHCRIGICTLWLPASCPPPPPQKQLATFSSWHCVRKAQLWKRGKCHTNRGGTRQYSQVWRRPCLRHKVGAFSICFNDFSTALTNSFIARLRDRSEQHAVNYGNYKVLLIYDRKGDMPRLSPLPCTPESAIERTLGIEKVFA